MYVASCSSLTSAFSKCTVPASRSLRVPARLAHSVSMRNPLRLRMIFACKCMPKNWTPCAQNRSRNSSSDEPRGGAGADSKTWSNFQKIHGKKQYDFPCQKLPRIFGSSVAPLWNPYTKPKNVPKISGKNGYENKCPNLSPKLPRKNCKKF